MEAHVVMPADTKRPGPLHLEDWQREPIDAMVDPNVRVLVLMWYSQSLKTTSVCARLMMGIVEFRERAMLVTPTSKVLKRFVRKFDTFLALVPSVAGVIKKNREGGSFWEDGIRTTDGRMPVEYGTSYSVSGMVSLSANLTVFDEYDSAKTNTAESGSPFDLMLQRGQQMADPLALFESTPSIEGESIIEDDFSRTAACERFSRCVYCGSRFFIDLDCIQRIEGVWQIVCPDEECGAVHSEADRQRLITDEFSFWEKTNPDAPEGWLGYHINQFHSAVMSVDETMQSYREDNMKGFTTQVLARAFKRDVIPQIEPDDLLDLHGPPPSAKPLAVTIGVDSQFGREARFECSLVEWHGDRAMPTPYVRGHWSIFVANDNWRAATRELLKAARMVDMTFVDVGSNEGGDKIKTLLRTQGGALFRQSRIKAIKGTGTTDWESTEVIQGGKRFRDKTAHDVTLAVYSDIARLVCVNHLANKSVILKDAVSEFPTGYHAQLASHWVDLVVSPTGIERRRFRQKNGVRDEALDCWMYAYAAYRYLPAGYTSRAGRKFPQERALDLLAIGVEG